jgi:hypothetical protein
MQILAMVDLHPEGLPSGWVRELAFRKTKDGSVRRDPVNVDHFSSFAKRNSLIIHNYVTDFQYYTDPTSGFTFRTLKSALSYLESGKLPKRAFIQKTSVHDIYSFDKCADLVIIFYSIEN